MIKKWQIGDQIHDHNKGADRHHPEASRASNSIEDFNTTTFVWTTEPETLPTKEKGLAAVERLDGSVYFLGRI
jgi:hypothetical protein